MPGGPAQKRKGGKSDSREGPSQYARSERIELVRDTATDTTSSLTSPSMTGHDEPGDCIVVASPSFARRVSLVSLGDKLATAFPADPSIASDPQPSQTSSRTTVGEGDPKNVATLPSIYVGPGPHIKSAAQVGRAGKIIESIPDPEQSK